MIPSPGLANLTQRIAFNRQRLLAPPPTLTVSEWADRYRMVPGYSAEPGPWVTARTPYLREIMDSFSEPGVNRVVFMKCARIGATEAGLNIVGYFMHQDPSAIMIVQPTADDAKDFSKDQLAPTIEDTPVLRAIVSDAVKSSKNTITGKTFPGGSLKLGGANSPRIFRRVTIRVLVLEECDGYGNSKSAKGEGDQMRLAEKRTETLGYRRKIYMNSTPTLKGGSRIAKEYAKSDQRQYHVPCPHCGQRQRLVWEQLKYKDRETPAYECVGCKALIDEAEKDAMVAAGEWVVTRPFSDTRGYHINALYSPFVRWSRLVEEWVEAQGDPDALQVFVNTALGEEWEDREAKDLAETVAARAHRYDGVEGDGPFLWHVPRAAAILTAGVDKQAGELRCGVVAYGPNEQSWRIDRFTLRGDTSRPEVWGALDEILQHKVWRHENGAPMKIRAMCVDSGDDPDPVYAWTRPRLALSVFAIKGASDPSANILPPKFTKTRLKSRLYVIGTQVIKRRLFRRVGLPAPAPYTLDAGPTFMHFNHRCDAQYFAEFFSQTPKRIEYRGKTQTILVKKPGARDEELDCEVYAYAALHLGPVAPSDLQAEWERVMAEGDRLKHPEPAPATVAPARVASSWLPARAGGWLG